MKFEEKNCVKINPIFKKCFIYFLIKNNIVVYVGQTSQGMLRPYQHIKDKDFNEIRLMFCDKEELNKLEEYYIVKYSPMYNKLITNRDIINLQRCRYLIRQQCFKYECHNFTMSRLLKIIHKLDINIIHKLDKRFITKNDYIKIIDYIEENKENIWDLL